MTFLIEVFQIGPRSRRHQSSILELPRLIPPRHLAHGQLTRQCFQSWYDPRWQTLRRNVDIRAAKVQISRKKHVRGCVTRVYTWRTRTQIRPRIFPKICTDLVPFLNGRDRIFARDKELPVVSYCFIDFAKDLKITQPLPRLSQQCRIFCSDEDNIFSLGRNLREYNRVVSANTSRFQICND